ncbi:non-specific serine/threonine protein kinase [Entamoeba marina]
MAKREVNFNFGDTLGEGSFGAVVLTTDKEDGKQYATKILEKNQIIRLKKHATVKRERDIMSMCRSPYIVRLYYTFQNETSLFYVLELCPNRDLKFYFNKYGSFSEEVTRHYIAEIATAVNYLHSLNIIHRDLKPENVLLDRNMHIKITDFGTACVQNKESPARKSSFVGTPEYVAPEIINGNVGFTKSVDYWSLGCMIFQFLTGEFPFRGKSDKLTFDAINACDPLYPHCMPKDAKNLCQQLMVVNMDKRLGVNVFDDLETHPFFNGLKFDTLLQTNPPPFAAGMAVPKIENFIYPGLLKEGEKVIMYRSVYKRKGLSRTKRDLIYTDAPRLFYTVSKTPNIKGEIPLTGSTDYIKKSSTQFIVRVPGRDYQLEDCLGEADEWIKAFESTSHKWK